MKDQDFCMWLQGYVELGGKAPNEAQWEMIKEHLQLVFNKQTSSLEQLKNTGSGEPHLDYGDILRNIKTRPFPSMYPDLKPYIGDKNNLIITC